MKKKALLALLTLGTLLSLSACGSSSSNKKCNGDTCKVGYRYNPEQKTTR